VSWPFEPPLSVLPLEEGAQLSSAAVERVAIDKAIVKRMSHGLIVVSKGIVTVYTVSTLDLATLHLRVKRGDHRGDQ
jgi:hypothetical protein